MIPQQTISNFIGRTREIEIFTQWLATTDQPWILYFYDALEKQEKKGGVGKTWLLRRCAELAKQSRQDVAVVMIDFFYTGDRDSVFLAEKIITGLQELYPTWTPTAFKEATQQIRSQPSTLISTESAEMQVWAALAKDLRHLDGEHLTQEKKTLLIFFDTFEIIEQNPGTAVLRQAQTFPDNYLFEHMKVVIAGRNSLDWTHLNWQGREREVLPVAIAPFTLQEMLQYLTSESVYNQQIRNDSTAAKRLYERTEGRPILLSLATDVLNQRIITLQQLLTIPKTDFESYLVAQINHLEDPLNWIILFMAHAYHRFNATILKWIRRKLNLQELVHYEEHSVLLTTLSAFSFIRYPGSGDDFVLHDEMRRLVVKHCWSIQDPDQSKRLEVSSSIVEYYEHELTDQISDQERQVTTIELLYHKLFLDLNTGMQYFEEQIQRAQRLWQLNFTRLLLLEASKFRSTMSLAHQNTLQFYEARLLRLEENPASIEVIKDLERQADPQWMEQRKADFLLEVGRCYHARSLSKEARAYFTRALDAVQDDEQLKAFILSYLGGVSRKQGQLAEAVRFFEQSTTILKGLGNRIDYANTLSTTGSVLAQQGKYEEAMRRCKIALHIREEAFAHKEASEIHIGYGLTTLGGIYLDSGNVLEAERYFKRAFDIYSRLDYKGGIAALYTYFGNVELYRGNQEEARLWFLKGEQAATDVNVEQYINSLNKLGRICLAQGHIQEAFSYLQRAIGRARQVPDNLQLTESLIDLAKVLDQMEQEDEAKTLLQEAEEIAEREHYANARAAIELIRAETALRQMHYYEAFRHLEQYCYYTLQHNTSEYSAAVRKTTDALLNVPAAEQVVITQELIDAWTSRGLADRYPELIEACKEFQEWSIG